MSDVRNFFACFVHNMTGAFNSAMGDVMRGPATE
jgi:hypothetical protein